MQYSADVGLLVLEFDVLVESDLIDAASDFAFGLTGSPFPARD